MSENPGKPFSAEELAATFEVPVELISDGCTAIPLDDEYVDNFHNYRALDAHYESVEGLIEGLEILRPELHRRLVKEQNETAIRKAKDLLNELLILRRYCDQHAG